MCIAVFLWAYVLGSIPTGYILFYKKTGRDIRREPGGSGTIGATNIKRFLGVKYFILVLGIDALKAFAAVWLCYIATGSLLAATVGSALAILGNIYPIWLGFTTGGKAVGTAIGAILVFVVYGFMPIEQFGIIIAAFSFIAVITDFISLGSLLSTMTAVVTQFLYHQPFAEEIWPLSVALFLMGVIIVFTHRKNIRRLLRGEEKHAGLRPAVFKFFKHLVGAT